MVCNNRLYGVVLNLGEGTVKFFPVVRWGSSAHDLLRTKAIPLYLSIKFIPPHLRCSRLPADVAVAFPPAILFREYDSPMTRGSFTNRFAAWFNQH